MKFKDYIRMALHNLRMRQRRTIFTIIGITIGAMMLITLISLGVGLQSIVWDNLSKDPFVSSLDVSGYPQYGTRQFKRDRRPYRERQYKKITDQGVRRISSIPEVKGLSHMLKTYTTRSQIGDQQTYKNIIIGWNVQLPLPDSIVPGVKDREEPMSNSGVKVGRFFKKGDNQVAVVGQDYLQDMGIEDYSQVIGQELKLVCEMSKYADHEADPFNNTVKVVGVMERDVLTNKGIVVPISLARQIDGYYRQNPALDTRINERLRVFTNSIDHVEKVAAEIRELGYGVATSKSALRLFYKVYGTLRKVLAIIGIVILIVASFGLVNTMTMATFERTKSIGIMKAVGASKKIIRRLFLVESFLMGLGGWMLALIWSLTNIHFLNGFIQQMISKYAFQTNYDIIIPLWVMAISLGLTIVMTMVAGYFPSNRAAKSEISEILAYE